MVGNNAICYEAIQRTFRNTIVCFLRTRMSKAFPADHRQRLRRPLEKEWEELVRKANLSREIGGTETKIKDDYDLLSIGHFYSVFESHFDRLFSAEAGHESTTPKPNRPKLLGNLKSIKDSRDPLSHPVEEEVSFEEAFGLLMDAKQVLSYLGFKDEADTITELARSLKSTDKDESTNLISSLPTQDSVFLEFVGRGDLLKDLADWFVDPNNKRCLLAGDGGKGKSAVAYRYAQRLSANRGSFDLVLWLSAKRRRFQEGTSVAVVTPDFTDVQSAVDRLLSQYGALEEELQKTFPEKRRLLLERLNEFPTFLVVDDIDTVLEDSDVVGLFTFEIPGTKSTVLLTSRRDIPGIKSFVVKGFEPVEADLFIESRIHLYGLDPTAFPPAVSKEIVQVTDGSPLYMDDLMRLTKIVPVQKAISMWGEKKGDEARKYALQRELEKLSQDAKRVLIAAAVSDQAVSFAEIENVLDISEERLIRALQELQTLFLFPKPRVVEGEQRFAINQNTRKLVQLVDGKSDLYGRIEAASKALAGKLPDVGRGIVSSLIRQAVLLMNSDRFQEAETLLINAAEKYRNAADLQGFLGFLYRRWGRTADARKRFEAAYKLKCKNPDTYRHWVRMEMYDKEYTRAIEAADKGLKLIPDLYELVFLKAESKMRSGLDFAARIQREKAQKLWCEAADELKKALKSPDALRGRERETSAAMYQTLIISLDLLGDLRELRHYHSCWKAEHPDDPNVQRQYDFISKKRGIELSKT